MASHVRDQIMAAAVTALTGLSTTGSRIWRDRDTSERPLQSNEVPGLIVEDDGEPAEVITIGNGGVMERTMTIRVRAHVKGTSGLSASLNQILKEVEVALDGAVLGGAKFVHLVEVGAREVSEASDQPVIRQSFDFACLYYTQRGVPDVAL